MILRLIFGRLGGLRRLSLRRGHRRRLGLRLSRLVIGDLRAGSRSIALEVDRAEDAQNQGEQRHQQKRCAPGPSGSGGGSFRLIQYSKSPNRRPMETLTWLKEKSRLVSHLVERFLVDDAEMSHLAYARACQIPPPPMVFWMLRNQYRWGRVTGPYVSTTRCCTFHGVKPKPRSSEDRADKKHRRARTCEAKNWRDGGCERLGR